VMGHIQVAGIDVGLVEAGLGDAGLRVVGNQKLADPVKEGKGPTVGADPVRQLLSGGGLSVGVAGGRQDRDKNLGGLNFSG